MWELHDWKRLILLDSDLSDLCGAVCLGKHYSQQSTCHLLDFRFCSFGSSAQHQYRGGERLHAVVSGQRHLQCYQQYLSDSAEQPAERLSQCLC